MSWIELAQNNSNDFSFYIWNLLRSFMFGELREYLCHYEWLSIKCLRKERCFKNRTADLRKTLHRRVIQKIGQTFQCLLKSGSCDDHFNVQVCYTSMDSRE